MAQYDRVIPPGGEGKIILKVSTKGFAGNLSKAARVYTNDLRNRIVWIGVKAFVKVPISVSPGLVYFSGFADDIVEKVVTIRAQNRMPLSLKPISFSISDKVEYRIETVEEGRCFRVVFKNKSATRGWYNGLLKLQTNYPDKPVITIRIMGKIRIRNRG
ncbi:MAG: hypothetical protein U9M96_00945 [Thermodesulfobacteriota bacterium]|nr:hypothetical protein [Thermodesulfobacteriota bacterium]